MSELSDRQKSLVSLGAAIASNCVPCVEYHIPEARKAGLSEFQIREAAGIADKVRRVPARMVLQAALARIGTSSNGSGDAVRTSCGCEESSRDDDSGCGR